MQIWVGGKYAPDDFTYAKDFNAALRIIASEEWFARLDGKTSANIEQISVQYPSQDCTELKNWLRNTGRNYILTFRNHTEDIIKVEYEWYDQNYI